MEKNKNNDELNFLIFEAISKLQKQNVARMHFVDLVIY